MMKTKQKIQLGERSNPVRLLAILYPTSQDRHKDFDMHFRLLGELWSSKSFLLREKSKHHKQQQDILLDKRDQKQKKPFLLLWGTNSLLLHKYGILQALRSYNG